MAHPSRSPTCSAVLLLALLSTAAAQPHPEGPTEATFDAGAPAVVDVPFHLDESGEVSLKLLPTDDDPVQDGHWSLRATVLRNGTPLAPAQGVDGQNGMDPVAVAAGETHVLRLEVEPGGVAGTTHLALVQRDASDGGGNGATLSPSVGIRLTAEPSDDGGGAGPDATVGGSAPNTTDQPAAPQDPSDDTDDPADADDGPDDGPDDEAADGPDPAADGPGDAATRSGPVGLQALAYALLALAAVVAAAALLRRA